MKKYSISKIYLSVSAVIFLVTFISTMTQPSGSEFLGVYLFPFVLPWIVIQIIILDGLKIFPSSGVSLFLIVIYIIINYVLIAKFEKSKNN